MKQVLILMLFFVCIVVSFAQSSDDKKKASDTVVTTGGNVEKLLIYETRKNNPLLPFLLNFFIGFGVGSLFQGDTTGGFLVLGADILSVSLIGCGMYFGQPNTISNNSSTPPPTFALALMSIGGLTLVVTRIVEMVIPFTYASSYNKKLQEELGISLGGLKPEFDINLKENAGLVFELAFTKKY